MEKKESHVKGIILVVVGVLLMCTLVICLYLYNRDNDLVQVEANVTAITNGSNKNKVTATYEVDNLYYEYNYYTRKEVNEGDKVSIYYHSNNVSSVKRYQTHKIIFLCPVAGLLLCILGLIDLVSSSNNKEEKEENEFKTKVVSVIGDTEQLKIITDEDKVDYIKSDEEVEETPVKAVPKKNKKIKEEEPIFKENNVEEEQPIELIKENTDLEKILPKYFYITNDTLVCELINNESIEINLAEINKFTKTINSNDELVKVVISNNKYNCILTNMNKVDLEGISNTIHNKLLTINSTIEENIEHKEY